MMSSRLHRPTGMTDATVQAYVEAIDPMNRTLCDRVDHLIRAAFPDVSVVLSYKMPTYVVGSHRLYVGAWKHGISLYGWSADRDGGFTTRHPELLAAKGTIRLRPQDAERITDDELRAFVVAVLA
jgi:uncharacterized protein YdhG (YjbR/CyaY superfamily)